MYCRSQSMSPKFFNAPVIFFLTRESCPDQVLELLVDVLGAEVARQRPCPKGSLAALCARVDANAPPPPLRFHRRFSLGCLLAISIFLFKKCCGFFYKSHFLFTFLTADDFGRNCRTFPWNRPMWAAKLGRHLSTTKKCWILIFKNVVLLKHNLPESLAAERAHHLALPVGLASLEFSK